MHLGLLFEQIEASRSLLLVDPQIMVVDSVIKINPFKVETGEVRLRLRVRRMVLIYIVLDIYRHSRIGGMSIFHNWQGQKNR